MTQLSPAALAVWQQYCGIVEEHGPARLGLAAALRAAERQLGYELLGVRTIDCSQLLLIAEELEDA
jgi:hypothetical protein